MHREWVTDNERDAIARAEQAALERLDVAAEAAEPDPIVLDESDDLTADTAEATVAALVAHAGWAAPPIDLLLATLADDPMHREIAPTFGRVIVGPGKVVGEAHTAEQSAELALAEYVGRLAVAEGARLAFTVGRAAAHVGLTAEHLAQPVAALGVDPDTIAMIECGCERMLAGDFVSAVHVLAPRFEDVLRQHLKTIGASTTKLERDASEATARTNDATLGALMRRTLADGRSVQAYLGADRWRYLDIIMNAPAGLNLRNQMAHGLTRLEQCSAAAAGMLVHTLFCLVAAVRGDETPPPA